jgi:hypothetical protein
LNDENSVQPDSKTKEKETIIPGNQKEIPQLFSYLATDHSPSEIVPSMLNTSILFILET